MGQVCDRIEQELRSVVERLRQLGGAVVIEDFPPTLDDDSQFSDPTEEDQAQAQANREIDFATRRLLLERANQLAEALERLREGVHGLCEECGEPIAPARLRAMPEATTCVRCQARREQSARQVARLQGEASTTRGGLPKGRVTTETLRRPLRRPRPKGLQSSGKAHDNTPLGPSEVARTQPLAPGRALVWDGGRDQAAP